MATDKLNIILQAFFKGRGEIEQAGREIGKLDKIASKTGSALKGMAAVGVTTAVALGAISIAALKQGSEIEFLKSKFDNLTKSIGTTSSALLGDMRAASGGMVSNADLMAGATDLMAGKLAKTHDQVLRLSTVSTQLGWDMGVLAQTINNQSVFRLDNLGLAVEDVIPKFEKLKESGMGVKEAFTEALIQAGEKNLGLLGSKADTVAGKIQQIITVGQNAQQAFAASFAVNLAKQMDELAGEATNAEGAIVTMAQNAGAALATLVGGIKNAIIGFVDMQIQLANFQMAANLALPDWALANPSLTRNQDMANLQNLKVLRAELAGSHVPNTSAHVTTRDLLMLGTTMGGVAEQTGAAGDAAEEAARDWGQLMIAHANHIEMGEKLRRTGIMEEEMLRRAEEEAKSLGGAFSTLTSEMDEAINEMYGLAAATGDFFMQARRFKDGEFNPFESLLESADKYGAHALQLADIGVGGGLFSQEEATKYLRRTALMHRADQLGERIAFGQIDAASAVAQLDALHKALYEGRIDVADEFFAGLPVQGETDIEANLQLDTHPSWLEYTRIRDQIEANPPTVVLNVVNPATEAERERFNRPPSGGGGGIPE